MVEKLIAWLDKHRLPGRIIVSVAAGIVLSKVLTLAIHEICHLALDYPAINEPMFDKEQLAWSLLFHSICAVIGAYFTARLAKEKAGKAVFILGTKELILWIVGIVLLWKHNPAWFNIAKAALGVPLALLGGKIYKMRNRV